MASKHPEMEHNRSSSQDQSTQPLTGSALQALVRGWIAGTAGLPGDMEGLARKGINFSFGPGGVNVNPDSALPTTDFYKEWLPGKQVGDENVTEVGSLFGGVGATKPVSLAKGALSRVAQAAPGPLAGTRAAMKGVIKAPGGNWLSGSVEDALKGLKRPGANPEQMLALDPEYQALGRQGNALNQFIDKQLTRYVKNDMATERDPIRALAERGTLHTDPEAGGMNIRKARVQAGYPEAGMAKERLAIRWEDNADEALASTEKKNWSKDARSSRIDPRIPDEAMVHGLTGDMSRKLGFDHLIDELRNATNPNSGLPANLLLKPESLDRVSVPQAVEHVAKINAWREAQKVEANQAIANNAATVLHKEYADAATNPKGLRWVELKGDLSKDTKDAISDTYRPGYTALRDALKYEGDTMGHCVGGYCDDVASGKSRIFSLRDAKGQPHVTIESKPGKVNSKQGVDSLSDADYARVQAAADAAAEARLPGGATMAQDVETAYKRLFGTPKDSIIQIKGKANKKPNDEYLPFVQDFVKSGKWSDVGDLQNSGLRRTRDALNELEQKTLREKGQTFGDYLSDDELKGLQSQWDVKKGFASGGSVTAGPWWDSYQSGPSDEHPTASAHTLTLEDFRKRITPNMLDAEGKFKAPIAGVNYMLEGLTPEQAYSAAQAQTGPEIDGGGSAQYQNVARAQMLDPSWRTGPNNGGGFLGGLGAAAQGMFDGVRTNPAIMAALTAGVGSSFNPAISEGLQSAGMSANAAKTAAPMVLNAGKTVLSGGSLADAAKGAAVGYAGGEIGGAVKDTTGSDFMGNAARTLAQTALNGGSLSIDELAAQYASGKLTDLSGLPPQVASIVVNLARNRKTTPGAMVGALSQVARKAS